MSTQLKMTGVLREQMISDLARPHPFAAERVGFASGRLASLADQGHLILLTHYHSIPDDKYLRDDTVGARIGPEAMTWAMEAVYHGRRAREGIFHVHLHGHRGLTRMSGVDRNEIPKLMPGFQSVGREAPHGFIILSLDHGLAWAWLPKSMGGVELDRVSVIGAPLEVFEHKPSVYAAKSRETFVDRILSYFRRSQGPVDDNREVGKERYSRQSFLGADAEERISRCIVGVVGLGGGGSHVVQQLAHIGFKNYVLFDGDVVEDSNLNRLVGASAADASRRTRKLDVAKSMIRSLHPGAQIRCVACRWQERPEAMRQCDIVFGCVDSYQGRHELEVACRRHLIQYIDIGMDVHGTEKPVIGGQVILSSPGGPCMRCIGFLTEEKLAQEAARYGNVGARPQVIWPNGLLASTAVGIAMELLTDWTRRGRRRAYFVLDGNEMTLRESVTLRNAHEGDCPHYPANDLGAPVFVDL